MSSAPAPHPPEGTSSTEAPEVGDTTLPAIKEARKGFLRFTGLTLKNSAIKLKNAISAVTWRPTKYVFRKTYNFVAWPINYTNTQWEVLKDSNLVQGIAFGLDSSNYTIFPSAHGHGGGDEGGGHGH